MDIKFNSGEDAEGGEIHDGEIFCLLSPLKNTHTVMEQNVYRNTNVKSASGEVSKGNREHVIG